MGFVTGFVSNPVIVSNKYSGLIGYLQLGGITLTSSILYLTVALHQRNRLQQSLMLKQQSLILNNIIEPHVPPPPPTAREARVSVVESAKDRWNGEIEGLVKKAQTTDWNMVRDDLEGKMATLWGKALAGFREAGDKVSKESK
jgi:altered-inheritance-of-mitochondria protein 5